MTASAIETAVAREARRFGNATVLDAYSSVSEALRNPALVRSIDPEKYEHGNLLDGTILMTEGTDHKVRRSVENQLFRKERLQDLEEDFFPRAIEQSLELLARDPDDLIRIGGLLTTVLSAKVAGVDFDANDPGERERLLDILRVFAEGEAIDASIDDPEDVKKRVASALVDFEERYYVASLHLRAERAPERADLLSTLLEARSAARLDIADKIIRNETAFLFEAGAFTSSQTLTNSLHFLFEKEWDLPLLRRLADIHQMPLMRLLRRCVEEALRLRPTNPLIRRRVVKDTAVAGQPMAEGDIVLLNTYQANRDTEVFGPDAVEFNPLRQVAAGGFGFGMSFGAGSHQCIGRTLAIGIPTSAIRPDTPSGGRSNVGIVTLMAKALLDREVARVATSPAEPDTASLRWTRWKNYPVRLHHVRDQSTSD